MKWINISLKLRGIRMKLINAGKKLRKRKKKKRKKRKKKKKEIQVETKETEDEVSVSREEVQICLCLFMGDILVVAGISSISQPVQCIEDDVGMKLFCNGVMPCNVVSVGRIVFKDCNWFVIVSQIMNFPLISVL